MSDAVESVEVLIVDDEELARFRLRTLLTDCASPRASVVGEAGTVADALLWLAGHRCDLILLDIQMPGADGLQLAATLRAGSRARSRADHGELTPAIVFVTAHAQHALKAFELEATDYLTKPVRRERLQATLARVAQRRSLTTAAPAIASASTSTQAATNAAITVGTTAGTTAGTTSTTAGTTAGAIAGTTVAPSTRDVLVVSERGRVVRVPLREVLYLKAELKYVTLRTAAHSYVLDDALADLEQRLGERFMRVHRNALVARDAVAQIERRSLPAERDEEGGEGWAVRIDPVGEWLAVSRRQLPAVREAIARHAI